MKGKRFLPALATLMALGAMTGLTGAAAAQRTPVRRTSAPITITFWNAYNATDNEEKTIVKDIIPAFERSHPGIKVQNVTLPYSAMQQKLLTSAAGGVLPDVARLDIIWTPQLAKLGTLMVQNNLPGFAALSKKVFPGPLSTNLYNGKYYGLPLDTNTTVLFTNTAVLAKHGIKQPPRTMAQFIADIKKMTGGQGKTKTFGYMDGGGTDLWGLVPWISSFGGSVLSPNLKTANGYLNGPKTVRAITTLISLSKAGYITGLLPGANGDLTGLAQGQYAMINEGPWDVPTMQQQYPKVHYKMSLFPAGLGGSRSVVGGEDIGVFNTNPAHEKAAWAFEKFMMSPYAQSLMQAAGQMSTLKNLPPSPVLKGLAYYNVFRKQLNTAVARPSIPNYSQVDTDISNAVTLAAQGKESVKAALDQATQQVDALLASN